MSRIKRKNLICVPVDCFLALRELLELDEFAVAMFLIEWQFRNGIGLKDDSRAARTLRIDPRRWRRIREKLLPHFDLSGGHWAHPRITEQIDALKQNSNLSRQASQIAWQGRKSSRRSSDNSTLSLFGAQESPSQVASAEKKMAPEAPVATSHTDVACETPAPAAPADQPASNQTAARASAPALPQDTALKPAQAATTTGRSLKSEVIHAGISLFKNTGASEERARQMMGTLLRDYDVGYIANAVDDALRRQHEISNVMGYVVKRLQQYPTKKEEKQVRSAHFNGQGTLFMRDNIRNPEVSAQTLGVSEAMANRLRQQSGGRRRLKLED